MVGRGLNILLVLFNITFAVMALYFIFKGGVVTPQSTALEYKDRGFALGDLRRREQRHLSAADPARAARGRLA